MQWEDCAIVLKSISFGEHAHIVTVLSRNNGLHRGLLKRGIVSRGDAVHATWVARLPEQLGIWGFCAEYAYSAVAMRDRVKLSMLVFLCEMLCEFLDERTPCPLVFNTIQHFLDKFITNEPLPELVVAYLHLELFLLEQVGVGLTFDAMQIGCDYIQPRKESQDVEPVLGVSIDSFATCPSVDSSFYWVYISSQTGRVAVHGTQDLLFRFPKWVLEQDVPAEQQCFIRDIVDAFTLTWHFFEENCEPSKSLTALRKNMIAQIMHHSIRSNMRSA